jgi:hypothetical protein
MLRFSRDTPSQYSIEVVIPLGEKDLPVFPFCVRGLRKNLLHEIKAIHVIAPSIPGIKDACRELDCQYIDERELLPEGPEFYRPFFEGTRIERSKWIYQQFLKLAVAESLGLERYLVYDSDTVLINPFKYEVGNRWILEFSDGYRSELDSLHRSLVPEIRLQPFSFMCHTMLMEQTTIMELLRAIESSTGRDWKSGIMESMDPENDLCFSEFELYGCYSLHAYRRRHTLAYWYNYALRRRDVQDLEALESKYQADFRSLSFHSYSR